MYGRSFPAKRAGQCAECGTSIQRGQQIRWDRHARLACHANCGPSGNPQADSEYYAGLADGQRYQDDKAIYGEALAERFALDEEMARWGEDY
jgi:hypothetical protein